MLVPTKTMKIERNNQSGDPNQLDDLRWLVLYNNDLFDVWKDVDQFDRLGSESVDLIITSPPYKKKDGYSDSLILTMARLCQRVLKPGGWMFVNFGQLSEEIDRAHKVQQLIKHQGLEAHQTIIWIKSMVVDDKQVGHYTPINPKANVVNFCHEYVFVYHRPHEKPAFDRLSVGVPFADKGNLIRGNRGANGDVHCAGDTWLEGDANLSAAWFLPYKTTGKTKKKTTEGTAHAYEMPEELVERCIRLSGIRSAGDKVIFDPFTGSGSTLAVGKRYGFNAVGIEIDKATAERATERWTRT